MGYVDKADLLAGHLPEDEVPIPGRGTVRVRGLSRLEMWEMRQLDTSAPGAFERELLSRTMLEPALTAEEVGVWQAGSGTTEVDIVAKAVHALSALDTGAAKEAYKEFDEDPDSEFRVPPSPGPGHDGGADASGDVG